MKRYGLKVLGWSMCLYGVYEVTLWTGKKVRVFVDGEEGRFIALDTLMMSESLLKALDEEYGADGIFAEGTRRLYAKGSVATLLAQKMAKAVVADTETYGWQWY